MKKFVLLVSFLLLATRATGQETSLDQGSYIYEANQPLYNLIDTNQWDPNTIRWTTASDDNGTQVNLNFDWSRWDQTFSTAWQSSNGCLSFTGICYGYTAGENGYIENTLYPLWTDLIAAGADSKMAYYGDNEKMIFGWYNMWEYYRNSNNSFEVVLWADDSYEFRYGSLDIENHNVYIGEEGNSNQEGGKTLNTYLYFNRYASGVNYGLDQHLANIGVNLEGASLYAAANTYRFDDYVPEPDKPEDPPPVDPCESDPQSNADCPGYVDPIVSGIIDAFTGNDLIFGDDPSDFYNITPPVDYGDTAEDSALASVNYGEDSFDFGDNSVDYGTIDNTTGADTSNQDSNIDFGISDSADADPMIEQMADTTDYTSTGEAVEDTLGYTDTTVYASTNTVSDEPIIAITTETEIVVAEESSTVETTSPIVSEREESLVAREETTQERDRGRTEIQKALDILSSLEVTKNNPAFSVPGSTDPVNIAMSTVNAEKELVQDLITEEMLSQLEETENQESVDEEIITEELLALENTNNETNDSQDGSLYDSENSNSIVIVDNMTEQESDKTQSVSMSDSSSADNNQVYETNETSVAEQVVSNESVPIFESQDSVFESDPTMVVDANVDVLSEEYTQSELSTNNELVDEILAENKNTSIDTNLNTQFDQLLATGATTIGQIVSGEQPDYTKYDVKPLPQQEQNTVAKAEAQLETLSTQDVKNNLDEYTKELQESGGFDSNAQTLTMLLMARVQGYNYGGVVLADRPTFYAPKSVYTTNRIGDNNNNLRLLLTDDRHRQLVDLQYEK